MCSRQKKVTIFDRLWFKGLMSGNVSGSGTDKFDSHMKSHMHYDLHAFWHK